MTRGRTYPRQCAHELSTWKARRTRTLAELLNHCPNYGRREHHPASSFPDRNATCCDKKLVIRVGFSLSNIVHLSYCRALLAITALMYCSGCQTGLQRPVPLHTEVLAPDIQVAPAANVELPTVTAPQASAPVFAAVPAVQPRPSSWPTNWVNTWISLENWRRFNELANIERYGGDSTSPFYRVPTATGTLSLKVGSRIASYDGLEYWLGFAPQIIGGSPYVHWVDAQKLLQPLVRPARYCCYNGSRTIVIDAGHGGRDLGANSGAITGAEKDYTLDWALRVQRLLAATGWNVVMTRTTDADLGLADRVAIADQANADFFLSLHFNSGSSNRDLAGIETYCLTPPGMPSHLTRNYEDDVRQVFPNNAFDEQNVQAAVRLHRALLQRTGAQDRGVRRARFMTVLRGQNRPAVLIEGGYLTNPKEAQRIASAPYRQLLAEAVATGLHLD